MGVWVCLIQKPAVIVSIVFLGLSGAQLGFKESKKHFYFDQLPLGQKHLSLALCAVPGCIETVASLFVAAPIAAWLLGHPIGVLGSSPHAFHAMVCHRVRMQGCQATTPGWATMTESSGILFQMGAIRAAKEAMTPPRLFKAVLTPLVQPQTSLPRTADRRADSRNSSSLRL